MMKACLICLIATAALADYTITDSGQAKGPVQFDLPSSHSASTAQPKLGGSFVTALPSGPEALQPLPRTPASTPASSRARPTPKPLLHSDLHLSQDSMQVVRGLVEAFLHKSELNNAEKRCLETNIGTLAGDVMGTVEDIVATSKAFQKGKGSIAAGQGGTVMSAGLDAVMKLTSLVTLSTSVLQNCVHGDALLLLKQTGQHMINGTYLEHRILVNGVDIAHSLSDAILAFEAQHFHRFGADIGIALRKILLSKATAGSRLPEGVPDQVIIQKATEGLMDGFFVRGSSFEVTDTAKPSVDIVVDLHRCVTGNSMFFKEIWMGAWDLFAQISANQGQHGLQDSILKQDTPVGQPQGQPAWQGELMVAMMQIPMALQRCGMSQERQHMLMEAIESLDGLHAHWNIPSHPISAQEATARMAKAVEAWTRWDFERFGFELGKLFRELIMLAFPQKYSVDSAGRLQLNKLQEEGSIEETGKGHVTAASAIFAAAMFIAVLFVVCSLAIRVRRSVSQARTSPQMLISISDIEEGDVLVE